MKKVFGVAILFLGLFNLLQSQDCNNQTACTTPITAIQICPQYCTLGADYTLSDIASLFECSLQIDNAQCITYLPLPGMENAASADQVSVTACNPAGLCETAVVMVTTSVDCSGANPGGGNPPNPGVNNPPVAVDDIYTMSCEPNALIAVLANDSDDEGSFNICSFTQTANGTLTMSGGAFTYTPAAGFTGTDTFTYTLCNASGSDTANVTITVNGGANTPPTAVGDFSSTSGEAVTINVMANDSDPDGNGISVCGNSQPSNGTVVQNGNQFVYTPNAGFAGNDSFVYDLCDDSPCGNGTASATVSITVEGDAECNDDLVVCTTPATAVEFCPEFCDLVGPWTITDATTTFNCSVVINDNCVTYTPLPGIPAGSQDQVTVTACTPDGTCQTIVVIVNILASCDDPPGDGPVAVNDTATSDGSTVSINPLENDYSPDGLTLTICDYTNPANGTVELIGNEFFYTPNPGFAGCDTFNYTICDSDGGEDTATVTVCTEACTNAPLFHCTNLNEMVTICADVFCGIDGQYVVTNALSSLNQGASVVIVSANCITYTPPAGFLGQDQLTITACASDAAGNPTAVCDEVQVNVNVQANCGDNSPPVAVDDNSSNFINTVQIIDVLPNDFDPDGDMISICDFTQPSNGSVALVDGMFVYTPNPDFIGMDSFEYTICDENGNMSTATVNITVSGPLANIAVMDDKYEVAPNTETLLYVMDNDGFPGVCSVEVELVNSSEKGDAWVNIDGSISFISTEGFIGETTLTYRLTACGYSDVATIFITVKSAEVDLYIPNGFSPNGDGINDEMRATGLDFFRDGDYTGRFIAFNRWGQVMFENDYVLETPSIWDGSTLPGSEAVEGTYFYILEITNEVSEFRTAGFVELRR